MIEASRHEIAPAAITILQELYLFRYGGAGESNIRKIALEHSLTEGEVAGAINKLDSLGLLRQWSSEGNYTLTGPGAIEAERRGVAHTHLAGTAKAARGHVISHLASVYEGKGYHLASVSLEELRESTQIEAKIIEAALADCCELAYAEYHGSDFRLTHQGYAYHQAEAKWDELHERYRTVARSEPHRRGRDFQALLSEIIELDGWDCQPGVTNNNEENDILISREREDYLVECKWEKNPIQAGAIRELQGKLSNRVGVRGIFTSMSGYTGGAMQAAQEQMNVRELLLFGPIDLEKLIERTETFSQILTAKHKHLVHKKVAVWR